MKKTIIILFVLSALAYLGYEVARRVSVLRAREKEGGRRGGAAVAVEVGSIRTGSILETGQFTGSLQPRYSFTLAPNVGGRLQRLLVDVSDTVKKGQLVARIEDEEYVRQVEQAKAEMLVAQASLKEQESSLEFARREYERADSLLARNIASESETDVKRSVFKVAEAKKAVAEAQVAQKLAALKAAEARLAYTKIIATWESGDDVRVVGERFVDEGAMLKTGDPIVSILDIGVLKGIVHVIERDYTRMRLGQKVEITTDAYPGKIFPGTVARIAPQLKESSRTARVEIEAPNADGLLKPGMFIRVSVVYGEHENATLAPAAAVTRRENQMVIFTVDADKQIVHMVPVKVGVTNADVAEILSPKVSGLVVTMGHHLLSEGAAVTLPGQKAEGGSKTKPRGKAEDDGKKQGAG
ncbi:MAG TPA: efflux RND transporter periplasmic adaptor subunit, partial [Candidatus Brocadiia bacterium]|nr:efflux RND transporter periplasmic adaptor subunit [Candidatus Brocadiia bacterium]